MGGSRFPGVQANEGRSEIRNRKRHRAMMYFRGWDEKLRIKSMEKETKTINSTLGQ